MPGPLSDELFRFLEQHIDSVYELELLLLLHRERDLDWTPAAIGQRLQLAPDFVEAALRQLRERRLIESRGRSFRLRAENEEVTRLVDVLAEAYVDYRVRIIAFIYSREDRARRDPLQSFADAFRLGKTGRNDDPESGSGGEE